MIETIALAGTVVGYLVKSLKENKDFKKFTSDFTSAVVNDLIRPVFLVDEDKPNKVLQDLADDPDEILNQESAKLEISKLVKKNPEILPLLQEMVQEIQKREGELKSGFSVSQFHYGTGDNVGRDKIVGK